MTKLPQLPVTELVALDAAGSYALPLSHEQTRLWFLHQASPRDVHYHMGYRVDLIGQLDVDALTRALALLIRRHEPLRAHFQSVDGTPYQVIQPTLTLPLNLVHLDGARDLDGADLAARLERLEQAAVQHPFDIQAPSPLMRAILIRIAPDRHRLLIVMHHIIGDGWSHAVLVADWCAFYRAEAECNPALRPPVLEVQFGDYVLWQRHFIASAECDRQVRYWVEQCEDTAVPLQLAPGRTTASPGTGSLAFGLPASLCNRLRRRIDSGRHLLSALLLAPFELLLAHFAHQQKFVLGMAMANRPQEALASMIGFFVNTVVMPSDTAHAASNFELLDCVNQRLINAQSNVGAPLDCVLTQLRAAGSWGETPLIKVLFVLQNSPQVRFDFPDLAVRAGKIPSHTSKFDLTLFATPSVVDAGDITLEFEYDPSRFPLAFIESMRDNYLELLRHCWSEDEHALASIPLRIDGRASVARGALVPDLHACTLPELFAQQAQRTPNAVALRHESHIWSYLELHALTEQYAGVLRRNGTGKHDVVALMLPRGPELVVAVLGILLVGASYAPIDPGQPALRLQRLWPGLQAQMLVCTVDVPLQDGQPVRLPLPAVQLDATGAAHAGNDIHPATAPELTDLAYVIYTSGSTGQPKGVEVEHKGLANVCVWIAQTLQLGPGDCCLLKTPLTFDAAARELFPTMISGACLVITPEDTHRDIGMLGYWLKRAEATILHCVPTQLQGLLDLAELPINVRAVMCGGEALSRQTVTRLRELSACHLWNVYGPTEATVDALAFEVTRDFSGDCVSIGAPLPNMQVTIADASGRPLPFGALGEICLSGVGIARGYRPANSNSTPFSIGENGARHYATGDLGRMQPDGLVEFMGRIDQQVKRHGVRLEPAVIEAALIEHPAVAVAHVLSLQDETAHSTTPQAHPVRPMRLVAFVTPAGNEEATPSSSMRGSPDWREVFETSYAQMPAADEPMFNTHGWVARASRRPLPIADVVSAADSAASRVLRWHPRRVLEIGCGTGLLTLRIAPHCEQYDGLDFAAGAVDYLRRHVQAAGVGNVRLFHAGAGFRPPGLQTYDAIVVNSVVQYFADTAELDRMLDAWRECLSPDGVIFVGDVRDARLAEAAAWWDRCSLANQDDDASTVKITADFQRLRDPELCLPPASFGRWALGVGDFAPPLIELKTSTGDNELVHFRYDVTLARSAGRSRPPVDRIVQHGQTTHAAVKRLQAELLLLPSLPRGTTVAQLREAALSLAPQGEAPAQALAKLKGPDGAASSLHWICRSLGAGDRYELISFPNGTSAVCLCEAFGCSESASTPLPAPGLYARFMQQIQDLPRFLHARLASYELPDQIIPLAAMPVTAHGKIDTRWLTEAAAVQRKLLAQRSADMQPASALETTICEIFTALVGVAYSPMDDFFLLGGHSLLATSAVSRLSQHLQIDIPLRTLFDAPSARQLAARVDILLMDWARGETGPYRPVPVRANQAAAELTRSQYRLWFIEQLGTAPGVYHVCHGLRLEGELDLHALEQSLADLVVRHNTLRSRFPQWLDEPQVIIDPPAAHGQLDLIADLQPVPAGEAMRLLIMSNGSAFNLQQDRLLRVSLARIAQDGAPPCHILGIVAHHIIIDGWSMALAIQELAVGYNCHRLGLSESATPLTIDYYDVAAAQNKALARGFYDKHLQYWWDSLDGAPARLSLPYDWPAPAQRSWRGGKLDFAIPTALTRRLRSLAAAAQATDFMLLLSSFEVLLAKLSGTEDFVVGTVIANRHHCEYEPLVGMLVNPLALRARVFPNESFENLLGRVRTQMISAYEHQDAPFEAVLEGISVDRRSDYQAGFQVLFAMQNAGRAVPAFDGLHCERVHLPSSRAMFDLSMEVMEQAGELRFELEFSADLFRPETAQLFADRYLHLLKCIAERPHVALAALPLATPSEQAQLSQWSHGPQHALPAASLTMVHLLIDACERYPNLVAIEDGVRRLTYADLLAEARVMADQLQALGLRRGQRVGLHFERDSLIAVASIAAQSLGVATAYLDPALPPQRLHALFEAACLDSVLAVGPVAMLETLPVLVLPQPDRSHCKALLPEGMLAWQPAVHVTDIAFVGFTSGSSGPPKAVLVAQHALVRRLKANDTAVAPLVPGDRAAHLYTMNYDGGLLSLFWPLCNGATVVFMPLGLLGNATGLACALAAQRITVLDAIPPVLSDLFSQPWPPDITPPLWLVITGGEACPADLPAKVLARCDVRFANQYGPCEAIINATTWVAGRRSVSLVPNIGRPLPGTDIFIVDHDDRVSAIGIAGEILIGGPSLAEGYLAAPELTAAKFVYADPCQEGRPARMYRSGDLGRWTANGEIEFLHRIDRQIQIRGMRSDPGEVEAALNACDLVEACHVAVEGEGPGGRFIAYLVPRDLGQGLVESNAEAGDASAARQRLNDWHTLFESVYHPDLRRPAGPGMDLIGWDDTATGEAISPTEMQAWLRATLTNMHTWPFLARSDVLEIGAGLGLVALAMAPEAASYLAIDISANALGRLAQMASELSTPGLELQILGAGDLDQLGERRFDLIILNSVIQYFPSAAYLRAVLTDCAARLRPGGRVFLGDVRDARLARRCHQEIAERRYGIHVRHDQLAYLSAEAEILDEELSVAPEFFSELTAGSWGNWQSVPMLKLDAGSSEMVRYRYDVWLTLDVPSTELAPGHVCVAAAGTDLPKIEQYLREAASEPLHWRAIPNARLLSVSRETATHGTSDATKLRPKSGIQRTAAHHAAHAIHPDEISDLARRMDRMVVIQPGTHGLADHYDAVFLPRGATLADNWPLLRWTRTDGTGPLHNHPLLGRCAPVLRTAIDVYASTHLPPHLCPSRYVIVGYLPSGTGRQRELSLLAPLGAFPPADDGCSANDLRLATMEDIWTDLLMTEVSGANADFFALGGHSLLAARLAAIIKREFGVNFPVLKVFSLRTLGAVMGEVIRLRNSSNATVEAGHAVDEGIDWRARSVLVPALTGWQRQLFTILAQVPAAWPRHLGFSFELVRPVPGPALAEAWLAVQEQHPMLQRRYVGLGQLAGQPEKSTLEELGSSATALADWVHKPMRTDGIAPIQLAWMRSAAGATRLAVRAHPAFLDADSIMIAMHDLALAERALRENQVPFAELPPTDFAALVEWEAANEAAPIDRGCAIPAAEVCLGTPVAVELSWTESEYEALAAIAGSTGVSVCAVLLGALAMHAFPDQQGGPIACPVLLRDELAACNVLGPFAIDVPLWMEAGRLRCLGDAALMAADQICTLLDSPRRILTMGAQSTSASWAFSYQDRSATTDGRSWQRVIGLTRTRELHTSPQWHHFKLSVLRTGSLLRMRLSADPTLLPAAQAVKLLNRLRACVLREANAC